MYIKESINFVQSYMKSLSVWFFHIIQVLRERKAYKVLLYEDVIST